MAAPQKYSTNQYNNQPQIKILSQKFEQDPNTGNYEYSYEQDNGQAVSTTAAAYASRALYLKTIYLGSSLHLSVGHL